MGLKQMPNGNWRVRVQPNGKQGKVYQATKPTKAEAARWEQKIIAEKLGANEVTGSNTRLRLSDLATMWYKQYGINLKDGEARKSKLDNAIAAMGNPMAAKFSAAMYVDYRSQRLDAGKTKATVNRELSYLKAMFNTLITNDAWTGDNPLAKVKSLKTDQTELTYLDKNQRLRLTSACADSRNPHLLPIVLICLSTGARWGEVESLKPRHVKDGRIQFAQTKSGKRRIIPIPPAISDMLKAHKKHSRDQYFSGAVEAFENALENARIYLPKSQLTHVLRHTYAVEFMQGGGNIVNLKNILGHSSITTTSIYLQFAPDNFEESLTLNPVVKDGLNVGGLLAQKSE